MRRYELDWLRVLVFGLLIFYHVGMFFVPWQWHIKNGESFYGLVYPMMFVSQWRLPILFVISGMGTAFALSKKSGWQFANERLQRLLIPLLTGILIIVPPQVYLERVASGNFTGNYFAFWPRHAFSGIYPEGNFSWHHLWFLPYLLFFSLLLIPLFLYLRNSSAPILVKIFKKFFSQWWTPYFMIIPLLIWETALRPVFPSTHAFWGDWYNMAKYITFFVYGFLCISIGKCFWNAVISHRFKYLLAGIISFSLFILAFTLKPFIYLPDGLLAFLRVANMWSWILCIFGFATTHLNRNNHYLSYANEAVYPFYILHQTITVFAGFLIMDLSWIFALKFSFMVVVTFGMSFLIYEFIIRRWKVMRLLFGLKNSSASYSRIPENPFREATTEPIALKEQNPQKGRKISTTKNHRQTITTQKTWND